MYNNFKGNGCMQCKPNCNCCPKQNDKNYHCYITKCVTEPFCMERPQKDCD